MGSLQIALGTEAQEPLWMQMLQAGLFCWGLDPAGEPHNSTSIHHPWQENSLSGEQSETTDLCKLLRTGGCCQQCHTLRGMDPNRGMDLTQRGHFTLSSLCRSLALSVIRWACSLWDCDGLSVLFCTLHKVLTESFNRTICIRSSWDSLSPRSGPTGTPHNTEQVVVNAYTRTRGWTGKTDDSKQA